MSRRVMGLECFPTPEDVGNATGTLLDILQRAAVQDLGVFFVFLFGEPSMDLEAAPYGGSRFPVDARLDGRTFAKFHLDIGIGDPCAGPPYANAQVGTQPSA